MTSQGLVFLSHWSGDASIVHQLHGVLDRSRAFVDIRSMNAGNNNLAEMQRAIEVAAVFVFVVSPQTPPDCFAFFEADCARMKKIRDRDLKILVWPIKGATYRNAPAWMQESFAIPSEYTITDVAREITRLTRQFLQSKELLRPPIYEGREDEERRLVIESNSLAAKSGRPVNVAFVSGFNGLGRRTFARNLLAKHYPALRENVASFDLSDSAEAVDLYLALMAELTNGMSLARMTDLRTHFPSDPLRQAEIILSCLDHWFDLKMPVLVQMRWGLLDSTGDISAWCAALIRAIDKKTIGGYLVLISGRRARPERLLTFHNVVGIQLRALDTISVNFILSKLIQSDLYNPALLENLSKLIGGHPDTAHQVAYLVNQGRSIDTLLTNKALIHSFKDKVLEDLLGGEFLDDMRRQVLQLICWYPQLDTKSVIEALGASDANKITEVLWELADYSLLERSPNDTYTVNTIAASTLLRQPEILGKETKERLVRSLHSLLEKEDLLPEQLEGILLTYSDQSEELPPLLKDALTPSTLYSVVERHYRKGRAAVVRAELERNMSLAAKLAPLALGMSPSADLLESILYYGADALVRIGQDPEPIAVEMEARGYASVFLIRGSAKYHREGDEIGAITQLKSALGRKKFRRRVIRMLARIQMRAGHPHDVIETLGNLTDKELLSDSGFLVLKIRALRATRQHSQADQLEAKLKDIGDEYGDTYVFEASRLIKKSKYPDALKMVDRALKAPKVNKAPLMTLRCSIELMMGDSANLATACALAEGAGRSDDACELRARAALLRRDWQMAEMELSSVKIVTWYTLQIKLQVLEVKAADKAVSRDILLSRELAQQKEELLRQMLVASEIRI